MLVSPEQLKNLLVSPGHLSAEYFDECAQEAKKQNLEIDRYLIEKNIIQSRQMGHIIAESIGVPYVNLQSEKILPDTLQIVPEIIARIKKAMVFKKTEKEICLGMVNPFDLAVKHNIEKETGRQAKIFLAMEDDFNQALSGYRPDLKEEYERALSDLKDASISEDQKGKIKARVVNLLLDYGFYNKASDVHIEPGEQGALVRFRIDGVMHDVLEITKEIFELSLLRIKVLSKMQIDEHQKALDGKFQHIIGHARMDVRVSIVPTVGGENIVLRLLTEMNRRIGFDELGLTISEIETVNRALKNSFGMILVVGPTGSGKTTTIYSMLEQLNRKEVHISTIEDPVEYSIEGISQIQTNEAAGLTFAKGLRAIVRQDPDIIMVGEIRDQETAGIAVNSAMTGHLVLSTLHANDAATTLPRLLEMGIKPFLVASTVRLIISQRLVRKICEKCRCSYSLADEEKIILKNNDELKSAFGIQDDAQLDSLILFKGEGCKVCAGTGYKDRVGIFEILEINDAVREAIVKNSSSQQIKQAAFSDGKNPILIDGVRKVLNGVTTLQELLRAI